MIFVDTGAWFATFVPNDPDHVAAIGWFDRNSEPLVTTDYVVDELLTLLKIRREYGRAIRLGEDLLDEKMAQLVGASDRCADGVADFLSVSRQGVELHRLRQQGGHGAT